MKRITLNVKLAGLVEGYLQYSDEKIMAVIVTAPIRFKDRSGKEQYYPKNGTFNIRRADIIDSQMEENRTAPMQSDEERCPECGTLMNVNSIPDGFGAFKEEAECPGCGYTEA